MCAAHTLLCFDMSFMGVNNQGQEHPHQREEHQDMTTTDTTELKLRDVTLPDLTRRLTELDEERRLLRALATQRARLDRERARREQRRRDSAAKNVAAC